MLLDFEVANFTRQCAVTGRAIAPGEDYYSTLKWENGMAVRRDYATEAWTAPPADVAWWKSRAPSSDTAKATLAPNDVLLKVFADLGDEPGEAAFRYVLGLLLLRRRLVKLEETREGPEGPVMLLDCPRREEQFELRVVQPDPDEAEGLEQRLGELLYGGAS